MARTANKPKSLSTTTEFTKTPYWLNVKSDIGNVGINLTEGIKDHKVWIDLLKEVSVDELNDELEALGEPIYIVQANATSETKVASLAERIKAKRQG